MNERGRYNCICAWSEKDDCYTAQMIESADGKWVPHSDAFSPWAACTNEDIDTTIRWLKWQGAMMGELKQSVAGMDAVIAELTAELARRKGTASPLPQSPAMPLECPRTHDPAL